MLFDEKKRASLLKKYEAESEDRRRLCRLLAVISLFVTAREIVDTMNRVDFNPAERTRRWKVKDIVPVLDALNRSGLVRFKAAWGRARYALDHLLIGPLWREAMLNGEWETLDRAVEDVLKLQTTALLPGTFDDEAECVRALRWSSMPGNDETLVKVWSKMLDSESRPGSLNPDYAVIEAFANPVDEQALDALPPSVASLVFPALLFLTLTDAEAYRRSASALFHYVAHRGGDCPQPLRLLYAERLILHGRLKEARAFLDGVEDASCACLSALLALSEEGDERKALDLMEAGLDELRRRGVRRPFFASWAGMFYPILLMKAGSGDAKIKGYLTGVKAWGTSESMKSLLPLLKTLLKLPGKRENLSTHFNLGEDGLAIFPGLLLAHWLGLDSKEAAPSILKLADFLEETGLTFVSSELRAVWGDEAQRRAVPHPLSGILATGSEWDRLLDALEHIGGRSAPADAKGEDRRILWEVGWWAHGDQDREVEVRSLVPIEQSRRKNGWSKGRRIALKRLSETGDSIAGVTEQDLRAARAIIRMDGYYGVEYRIDIEQALLALAGHPLLVREDRAERVEVLEVEPVLTVRQEKGGCRLQLTPYPSFGAAFRVVLDGPNRLAVTRFAREHLRMASLVGEDGVVLPDPMRGRLMETLEKLPPSLVVHSDVEGVGSRAETVRADGRICVQLQPNGDGLEVEAVVRPLGPSGASCRPGAGGTTFFGSLDGRRVQALRDLPGEAEALATFLRACPALSQGEETREAHWLLMDPALALEFLSQVDELGDAVTTEWPHGQSMKLVGRSVEGGSFKASLRRSQDWFALSGEVQVDEGMVLKMGKLIEGLQEGYGRFVNLGNGEFLPLAEDFKRRLEALVKLGDMRGEEVRLPPLAAGLAEELLDGAGQVDADPEWRADCRRVEEAQKLVPKVPATLRGELRDYQQEGFRWLMRLAHWGAGACLADDMGLGKTIQTLAMLVARGPEGPSLVVAPTSVCPNWADEARRFAPTLNVKELKQAGRDEVLAGLVPMDLLVLSYGLLQSERARLSKVPWNVVVLDEAQAIKNTGAKRSLAAMKLNGRFRVATTGTPIENQLSELWNIFRFLNPGYLGSAESFSRRFAVPIERDGDRVARQQLRRMIRPFILRRTKDEVLSELPEKTEITLTVDLNEKEWSFYEALRRKTLEDFAAGPGPAEKIHVFAALMKLRRACCNVVLAGSPAEMPSAKLEAFADLLGEVRGGGHKALVFSQFVDHLAILQDWLTERGIPFQYLDGSTPPEERRRRVAAFQAGEGDCFLISLRAGGTGLNLTAADCVIHMDPWWNPAVEEQASDRAHRIGQTRPVTVYRIVARGTIEEKIVALHAWKRDLADGLLEDSGRAVKLSAEELLNLIRDPA